MSGASDILVFGFGNPGRLDDGLGPAVAQAIEALALPGVTVEANYQLSVEDADTVARHATVYFVDADTAGPGPFTCARVAPHRALSFSSHSVRPEALAALAEDLFDRRPECWLVGVRGYEFDDYGERLSPGARANLTMAVEFLKQRLITPIEAAAGVQPGPTSARRAP